MAIRCDDCGDLTYEADVAWAVCRECVTTDGEPMAIFADRWRCAWQCVGEAVALDPGCDTYGIVDAHEDGFFRGRDYAEAIASNRLAEARALLERVGKYVIEDKAATPGATRLVRVTNEIRAFLRGEKE